MEQLFELPKSTQKKVLEFQRKFRENSKSSAINFEAISKIFRGGCIIRAQFLNRIAEAYKNNPNLENLLFEPYFTQIANESIQALREVVSMAALRAVPVMAFSSALAYYDSLSSTSLSTNLIQAQRDFFGAHTYERLDREGFYHFESWGQ